MQRVVYKDVFMIEDLSKSLKDGSGIVMNGMLVPVFDWEPDTKHVLVQQQDPFPIRTPLQR